MDQTVSYPHKQGANSQVLIFSMEINLEDRHIRGHQKPVTQEKILGEHQGSSSITNYIFIYLLYPSCTLLVQLEISRLSDVKTTETNVA